MATTTETTTETVVHFWIDTFYGPYLCACGGGPINRPADQRAETTEGVTCAECIEWTERDGADD